VLGGPIILALIALIAAKHARLSAIGVDLETY
jgi:hypothetical protein